MKNNENNRLEKLMNKAKLKILNDMDCSNENVEIFQIGINTLKEYFDSMTEEEKENFEKMCEKDKADKEAYMKDMIAKAPSLPYPKIMYYLQLIKQDAQHLIKMDNVEQIDSCLKNTRHLYDTYFDMFDDKRMVDFVHGAGESFEGLWLDEGYGLKTLLDMLIEKIDEVLVMDNTPELRQRLSILDLRIQEVLSFIDFDWNKKNWL